MARYSPPNRAYPQELPNQWKFEDGTIRTDLQELSDAELNSLGWHGPITMPEDIENTSYYTHEYTWNPDTLTFDVKEFDLYQKQQRIDYKQFLVMLRNSTAYTSIKAQASSSLALNTSLTEFMTLLSDARANQLNPGEGEDISYFQASLSEVLSNATLTTEELAEIQTAFTECGLFSVYTLA